MEQKFILTHDGHLRFGVVRLHRHLLQPGDVCMGGGYYDFDYTSGTMVLSRSSYDYGPPRWDTLADNRLILPREYAGMRLVYHPENHYETAVNIMQQFTLSYE